MPQVLTKEKKQKIRSVKRYKYFIAAFIPLILLLVFYLFRNNRIFALFVSTHISQPLRRFAAIICSHIPFSVMEILYTLLGIGIIIFLIRTIYFLIRKNHKIRTLFCRFGILLLVIAYIWMGFCFLWGIVYYCPSFLENSDLVSASADHDSLLRTSVYFLENANRLSTLQPRDSGGHFAADQNLYFQESVTIYEHLQQEFPCLVGYTTLPKKMVYSKIMSILGFTGIYFPFTGESNINMDAPACTIPFTVAHELAHQRGVYSESEANFVGVAACTTSDSNIYAYSGFLSGLIYLMNALYSVDYDGWCVLRSNFSPELEQDWMDNNTYWKQMDSHITEASETVYDGYLKAQGQELGISSYGECVHLLIAYYGAK